MRAQLEKGMCGIGVVLKEDIDGVVVKEILPGGPADKTGSLRVGDIIYRVQVGAFRDKKNAENYLSVIKKAGFPNAFIVASKPE